LCFIAHLYEANGGTDMEVLACFRPCFLPDTWLCMLISLRTWQDVRSCEEHGAIGPNREMFIYTVDCLSRLFPIEKFFKVKNILAL